MGMAYGSAILMSIYMDPKQTTPIFITNYTSCGWNLSLVCQQDERNIGPVSDGTQIPKQVVPYQGYTRPYLSNLVYVSSAAKLYFSTKIDIGFLEKSIYTKQKIPKGRSKKNNSFIPSMNPVYRRTVYLRTTPCYIRKFVGMNTYRSE